MGILAANDGKDITNLKELMSEIAKNEFNFNSPNLGDLKKILSKTKRGKKGMTVIKIILVIIVCIPIIGYAINQTFFSNELALSCPQ